MQYNEGSFWKKLVVKSTASGTVEELCNHFWNRMRVCFSHVEFFCSPNDYIFHKLSREDQKVPFSVIFSNVIKAKKSIEGFFVFRCCYFTSWSSKVFHLRIFYDLDRSLDFKLYSDARVWFILSAFCSLTNDHSNIRVFIPLDQEIREFSLTDDTLESFVDQNKLLSPLSDENPLILYFF
jgi:hypothetical protein